MKHGLLRLVELGQSPWYDFIKRDLLTGGELKRLIDEDGLRGMTSNPTIFEKAIGGSNLYDEDLVAARKEGKDANAAAEAVMVADVKTACDLFKPLYDSTGGKDGFVSIECHPGLANDTEGTIAEARKLWRLVDRPNLMVKIPGTAEGVPAIRRALAEGLNINVTLLFAVERYEDVMEAYLSAMEERVKGQKAIDRVQSVASFFVSRVDTAVDKQLKDIISVGGPRAEKARTIESKIAIANAKLAYERFQKVFSGARWSILKDKGANFQRPLWASTSTKNPALSDTLYVEALVAPNTVNTLPPETFNAYRDHGDPKVRATENIGESYEHMKTLAQLGIDIRTITKQLETDGVAAFEKSYQAMIDAVSRKTQNLVA